MVTLKSPLCRSVLLLCALTGLLPHESLALGCDAANNSQFSFDFIDPDKAISMQVVEPPFQWRDSFFARTSPDALKLLLFLNESADPWAPKEQVTQDLFGAILRASGLCGGISVGPSWTLVLLDEKQQAKRIPLILSKIPPSAQEFRVALIRALGMFGVVQQIRGNDLSLHLAEGSCPVGKQGIVRDGRLGFPTVTPEAARPLAIFECQEKVGEMTKARLLFPEGKVDIPVGALVWIPGI